MTFEWMFMCNIYREMMKNGNNAPKMKTNHVMKANKFIDEAQDIRQKTHSTVESQTNSNNINTLLSENDKIIFSSATPYQKDEIFN